MSDVAHRRRSLRSDGVVGSDWNLSFSSLLVPLCSATRSNGVGVVTAARSLGACAASASPSEVSSSNETGKITGPHRDFTFWIPQCTTEAKVTVDLLETVEKVSMDGEEVENSHSQCSKKKVRKKKKRKEDIRRKKRRKKEGKRRGKEEREKEEEKKNQKKNKIKKKEKKKKVKKKREEKREAKEGEERRREKRKGRRKRETRLNEDRDR
ncbi:hypothetical protein G5I_04376 [Acromyrmex echinatior]|uniref:Uncharacterized protein n=1 Tax=Acromyrmex echinatior TaxID=103372 RepID=F4WFG8_ACREC|nr:hypothetical protein G5I_04376 [Acromyrmex echinatior]